MRNDEWLALRLSQIWDLLFPELERRNNVSIRFKGKWQSKLGHITRLRNKDTEIAINSILKDEEIPDYVLDLTIAHELVHYLHGFHSPHDKKHKHPHKGNVVDKELVRRGFSHLISKEKKWMKINWEKIIKKEF